MALQAGRNLHHALREESHPPAVGPRFTTSGKQAPDFHEPHEVLECIKLTASIPSDEVRQVRLHRFVVLLVNFSGPLQSPSGQTRHACCVRRYLQ